MRRHFKSGGWRVGQVSSGARREKISVSEGFNERGEQSVSEGYTLTRIVSVCKTPLRFALILWGETIRLWKGILVFLSSTIIIYTQEDTFDNER